MLTIEEALDYASRGYYIHCKRGNVVYIGYEGPDSQASKHKTNELLF